MRCLLTATALATLLAAPALAQTPNSVIFFHPDGTGANHWNALRTLDKGPDGDLNWDRLPGMAIYTGHLKDALTGTSNGGATVHAFGVKVVADSFGKDGTSDLVAASGKPMSIAKEAMAAGRSVGLVQTGHIAEPGSAAFVASVNKRSDTDDIAKQVIESGASVILGGGERFLLPEGVEGKHGKGERKDGLNLIEEAKKRGYTIVYTKQELAALDLAKTDKLLGVFARSHTFNDKSEEKNKEEGKEAYNADAPSVAEMSQAALTILSRDPDGFFLVAEEEGTDNLANNNNAKGQFEALRRADAAIGVFRDFIAKNPATLMLMTADSDAGGMQIIGPRPGEEAIAAGKPLPATDANGSPLDGVDGTGSLPFTAAADKAGKQWPFAVTWAGADDVSGGILVRGEGVNSNLITGKIDNTGIYRIMYQTLFGTTIN